MMYYQNGPTRRPKLAKEILTLATANIQKVENDGTFDYGDPPGNTHQKYKVFASVPGSTAVMELSVVIWGKPGAPCPLAEGEVANLTYSKTEKDGKTYYRWEDPSKKSGGGGRGGYSGPRIGLEVSQEVGGRVFKATWLGAEDKVSEGALKVKAALVTLLTPSGGSSTPAAPTEEVPF